MIKWIEYIKLFWYFAINWNPVLAAFMMWHEIRGERRYKISTSKPLELTELTIPDGDITHGSRYEAVNYYILEALLTRLKGLIPPSSFTDLGCGKGRALVVAAYFGFTKIRGVDFAVEVCKTADYHLKHIQDRFPQMEYSIYCQNVPDYEIHPDEQVFFLFNPFNDEVIEELLEKVEVSQKLHPRTIYFLYASPKYIDVFFEYEYETIYHKRKLKWLDGAILKKDAGNTVEEKDDEKMPGC